MNVGTAHIPKIRNDEKSSTHNQGYPPSNKHGMAAFEMETASCVYMPETGRMQPQKKEKNWTLL